VARPEDRLPQGAQEIYPKFARYRTRVSDVDKARAASEQAEYEQSVLEPYQRATLREHIKGPTAESIIGPPLRDAMPNSDELKAALTDPEYYRDVASRLPRAIKQGAIQAPARTVGGPGDLAAFIANASTGSEDNAYPSDELIKAMNNAGIDAGDPSSMLGDMVAMLTGAGAVPAGVKLTEGALKVMRRAGRIDPLMVKMESAVTGGPKGYHISAPLSEQRLALAQKIAGGETLRDAPRLPTYGGYWEGETNPMFGVPYRGSASDPGFVDDVTRLGGALQQAAVAGSRQQRLPQSRVFNPITKRVANSAMVKIPQDRFYDLVDDANATGAIASAHPGGRAHILPYDSAPESMANFNRMLELVSDKYGIKPERGFSDPDLDRFYIDAKNYTGVVPGELNEISALDSRVRALTDNIPAQYRTRPR